MPDPAELHTPFYPEVFTVTDTPTETMGQFDALLQIRHGHIMTTLELPLHVMNCGDSQGILVRPFMARYDMRLDVS